MIVGVGTVPNLRDLRDPPSRTSIVLDETLITCASETHGVGNSCSFPHLLYGWGLSEV